MGNFGNINNNHEIPIVDISDPDTRWREIVHELNCALQFTGFVYLINHGISEHSVCFDNYLFFEAHQNLIIIIITTQKYVDCWCIWEVYGFLQSSLGRKTQIWTGSPGNFSWLHKTWFKSVSQCVAKTAYLYDMF